MANVGNILENINEVDGGDSPISRIYENLEVPHDEPLEVNYPNPNFIMLSDSFRPKRDFAVSVDGPLSTSEEDRERNSSHLDFIKVVSHLASSIKSYTYPDVAIVTLDD